MYDVDLVNRAVRLYIEKRAKTFRELGEWLDIGKSTLQRWVTHHPFGKVKAKKATSTKSLLSTAGDQLKTFFERNPFASADDAIQHLKNDISISTSKSTVCRTLKALRMVRKIPSVCVTDSSTEATHLSDRRNTFSEHAQARDPNDVVSIDESCFYLNMKPIRGYTRKGGVLQKCSQKGGIRVTLLMAVATCGVVGWQIFKGACNKTIFAEFISDLDFQGRKYALLDNVSFHHTHVVANAFAAKGVIAWFLPPYTPQWQPIEYAFAVVKRCYRQLTHPDIFQKCEAAICMALGPMENTFNHCWRLARSNALNAPNAPNAPNARSDS